MPTKLHHPYQDLDGGDWIRGNLHLHPRPRSKPDDAAKWYSASGYGFLGLTEHDMFYGLDAIDDWDNHGLILIPGNEITKNGPHILHVGARQKIEPEHDRQYVIDQINRTGGFAIMNHPNLGVDFGHCSIATLKQLTGYLGIEIFNASGLGGAGSPYATDKWDMLLSRGRRIWGYASDDYHSQTDARRGWITAYVKNRSLDGVLHALRQGRFYASTGVTIEKIEVAGQKIQIEASNAHRIVAVSQDGRRAATADASRLEYCLRSDQAYVRFECWGRGEQMAWTQPFWTNPANTLHDGLAHEA